MKMIAINLAIMAISCVTMFSPDVIRIDDGIVTLGLYTGSHGESFYKDNFEKAIKKICKKKYVVVEITDWPSTLEAEEIEENYSYWVVQCL
jgi:hypothetical protein